MKNDVLNFLLGFAIVAAISVVVCGVITVSALRQRDRALAAERETQQQLYHLRATMAAQGIGELF